MSSTVDVHQPFANLDHVYGRALPELGIEFRPATVPSPEAVVVNRDLAVDLGIDPDVLESPEGVAMLAGNTVPDGATPIAMAYAGHQFGNYSPRLGDGRAVLLGELATADGLRDIHLKGSGRTPFSRGGDGKATLGPMLREYLMAEAMHALGVPTGRALAVVTTGEQVRREQMEAGAVLTRVASSHIRVGTFEYAARQEHDGDGPTLVQRLADHAIERHHPELAGTDGRYLAFFDAVLDAQARLIADWMLIGFIHGVMNTDNMTVSGESIDFGPCAFMDRFDPATVYSSIDHAGRYAYGNQPQIAQWDLARLAEALLPLIDDDTDTAVEVLTERLTAFPTAYGTYWLDGVRLKLGLSTADEGDEALAGEFFALLQQHRVDMTSAFRSLSGALDVSADAGTDADLRAMFGDSAEISAWIDTWRARVASEGRATDGVAAAMDLVNPIYIPRNHLVDEALAAAAAGDLDPFRNLLALVTHPFDAVEGAERFAAPAPESFDDSFRTYCGT